MRLTGFLTCLLVMCFAIACSNGANPSVPDNPDGLGDNHVSDAMLDTRGVFGAWNVRVDTKSMTAEILPARNALAIGDVFDADLSQFLTVSPCSNCLSISRVFFNGYDDLSITVRMKHPFGDIVARPDLHGFDVRGIFIAPPDIVDSNIEVMPPSATVEDASYGLWLLNPDGYTSHFDELVTDERYFMSGADVAGNLNPFLRFFDDYGTAAFDPDIPEGHNVMPVGSSHFDRTAVFGDFDGDILNFYIVADVAYGHSATWTNRPNPQYYLPAYNRTEPWRVEYWLENNTLDKYDNTSTADIVVQVFDWQHGATVDPDYPDPDNLSGIPVKSDVHSIELSVPLLQDDPVVATLAEAGSGTPTDPLQYRLTVTNINAYNETLVTGLLAIRDDLYGQTGRMAIPVNPAGFPYETLDILDYALYMPVYINFERGNSPWQDTHSDFGMYELYVPLTDQYAASGNRTTIHPDYFMDPSHKKFQYRWDYNYDGVTFDIDGSGLPSPEIEYATPGRKNAALRVRTNSVPAGEQIFEIPVYAEGVAYSNNVPSPNVNRTTTSATGSHSIYATEDNVYLAYTSEIGGQRAIRLAIMDRDGNITTHQVTDNTNTNLDPSIYVRTSSNPGVYIAYSSYDGISSFVRVTWGNLDGTGFDPSHDKRVSTELDALEFTPILYNHGLSLCVYYFRSYVFAGFIYGAHSDDYGASWIFDDWLVDNGSSTQINPSTAYGGFSRNFLVWEDYKDTTDYGADLYMAETTDGYTFTQIRNISQFRDKTYEIKPSAGYWYGLGVISYLAYPEGSSTRTARLKFIGLSPYDDSHFDYALTTGSGTNLTHTRPAVQCASHGNVIVSYGSYNTSTEDLTAFVLDARQTAASGFLEEIILLEQPVGSIAPNYYSTDINPAIASRRPIPNVSEIFVAFRDYTSGSYESSLLPIEFFGEAVMTYIVMDAEPSL